MTLSAEIANSLSENALSTAIEQAKTYLKSTPSDKIARNLYIDLLMLSGDYERADAQCNLAATFSPEDTMGFALLRNQLRAMAARDAWFGRNATPAFPQGPSDLDKSALLLGLAHKEGSAAETRDALESLETLRGEQPMIWNGKEVSDFRDLDDRIPHALEVIMTGGAYLWVDFGKIAAVDIEPVSRPRDLALRRADLQLVDGASASVLLPAIYHGTTYHGVGGNASLILGRETEWIDEASGITTGRGQKCFLAGDELVSFHDAVRLGSPIRAHEARRAANG